MVKHRRGTGSWYAWVVVAASALGLSLGIFPVGVSSFPVFFPALQREFHAGRGAIALGFTISTTMGAFLAPGIGRLCDRIGARPVIIASLSMFGVVLLSAQMIAGQLSQLYTFYFVLGIISPGTNSIPYGLLVSRWFNRRRGLALGIMMIGIGGGAIVVPALARMLIGEYGWRATYAIFGCAALVIGVPSAALFLKESPYRVSQAPGSAGQSEGLSWLEIRSSSDFTLLITVFVLVSASVQACLIHMVQIMADAGASADVAAAAVSVSGVALLAGRVTTGYFLDRFSGGRVAQVVFASAAVGVALLAVGQPLAVLAGAFLTGLGMGAEADIIAFLLGRYFGLRSFGTAFGFAFGSFILAGGVGPLLMGFAFDRTGSYRLPLSVFFAATVLASSLVGRLGPYRFGVKERVDALKDGNGFEPDRLAAAD